MNFLLNGIFVIECVNVGFVPNGFRPGNKLVIKDDGSVFWAVGPGGKRRRGTSEWGCNVSWNSKNRDPMVSAQKCGVQGV